MHEAFSCKYSLFVYVVNIVNYFYLFIYLFSFYCKRMSKRQPNYTVHEIEVTVSGVEKTAK